MNVMPGYDVLVYFSLVPFLAFFGRLSQLQEQWLELMRIMILWSYILQATGKTLFYHWIKDCVNYSAK